MTYLKRSGLFFCLVTALAACNRHTDQAYLIQHPAVLKNEVMHCQDQENLAGNEHCQMVMQTADQFMSVLNEQQEDPERFGQKVLETQAACVKAKLAWQDARGASGEDEAKRKYQDLQSQVRLMQAVIGMNSPE